MADSARSGDSLRWLMEVIGEAPSRVNEQIVAGMLVGRYRLLEPIGRGGFGMVFRAVDTELGREIALKLMSGGKSGANAEARLKREAQAMARLSHANVITVYDAGSFEHGLFIAMELVDGGTLAHWLSRPHPWQKVVELFVRAGRGLEAAHRAGLVHRDFKPENVLVDREEHVRVTDFGVARMMDSAEESLPEAMSAGAAVTITRTGAVLGTPAYMAPEQMSGKSCDARADVFSFCVSHWQALYREAPFGGGDLETLRAAIATDRVRVPARVGEVPARVRRVLERGLRAHPADRYQTMAALLAGLEGAARGGRRRAFLAVVSVLALGAAAAVGLSGRAKPPQPIAVVPVPPAPHSVLPSAPQAAPKGTLVVQVNVEATSISLDGQVVAASARTARVEVDPGKEHELVVSAAGYRPAQKRVRVGPGATVETRVSLSRVAPLRPHTVEAASPPAIATPGPGVAAPVVAPPAPVVAPPVSAPPPAVHPNAAIDPYRH